MGNRSMVLAVCGCVLYMLAMHIVPTGYQYITRERRGGRLLNEALDSVLGPRNRTNLSFRETAHAMPTEGGLPVTKIRIRCEKYQACEDSTPMIEISNQIIYNNTVYFNHPDQQSMQVVERFPTFFAAVPGRLPSCLGEARGANKWLPGPKFEIIDERMQSGKVPRRCTEYQNISAHFLFVWNPDNVFHALNDNLLKVLTSLVLQRYTQTGVDVVATDLATLYTFDVSHHL
jgi:hypothetical protein